jgi:hypothetical protein
MAGVFQNIDPPPLSPPSECVGGKHTRWVERGVGGQYFGRLLSVLYIFKYFAGTTMYIRPFFSCAVRKTAQERVEISFILIFLLLMVALCLQ